MLNWILVTRRASYTSLVKRFEKLNGRQRVLRKLHRADSLSGRQATPAKGEFQTNLSELREIKKELFKVRGGVNRLLVKSQRELIRAITHAAHYAARCPNPLRLTRREN